MRIYWYRGKRKPYGVLFGFSTTFAVSYFFFFWLLGVLFSESLGIGLCDEIMESSEQIMGLEEKGGKGSSEQ